MVSEFITTVLRAVTQKTVLSLPLDLNAAGQRGGVNGEVRVDRQRAGQQDGRAGQAWVKGDDRAVGGRGDGLPQRAGPAVGGIGDYNGLPAAGKARPSHPQPPRPQQSE